MFLAECCWLLDENIYGNVGQDDTDNVSDEEHGPEVNELEVRCRRDHIHDCGCECSEDKESCESTHEPVIEVPGINKQSEVDQKPQKKSLDENSIDSIEPNPAHPDGELEDTPIIYYR